MVEIVEMGSNSKLDYGIIKLDDTAKDVWPRARLLEGELPADGDVISIIQFPDGLPKKIDVGTVKEIDENYIKYDDVDTLGGSSGGPVFNTNGRLIGVHVLGGCHKLGGTNKAVPITNIIDDSKTLEEL